MSTRGTPPTLTLQTQKLPPTDPDPADADADPSAVSPISLPSSSTSLSTRAHKLSSSLSRIAHAPAELRALADDLAHTAAALKSSTDANYAPLDAIDDDLAALERAVRRHSALQKYGWETTIPNLHFAATVADLRERLTSDVKAMDGSGGGGGEGKAPTVFEEEDVTTTVAEVAAAAIAAAAAEAAENEERRDVLMHLPPPLQLSRVSSGWRRASLEADNDEAAAAARVKTREAMAMATSEEFARRRRSTLVRQIRDEDDERRGQGGARRTAVATADLLSIMTPTTPTPRTVLSFSKLPGGAPWEEKVPLRHVASSYFSPLMAGANGEIPVRQSRSSAWRGMMGEPKDNLLRQQVFETSYFSPEGSVVEEEEGVARWLCIDTKVGGVLCALPFLGVVAASLGAVILVKGASSLLQGFCLVSAFLSLVPLIILGADVVFSIATREVLGPWWASILTMLFFGLGAFCLIIGVTGLSGSGGWLAEIENRSLRKRAAALMIAVGLLQGICFGVSAVNFVPASQTASKRAKWVRRREVISWHDA